MGFCQCVSPIYVVTATIPIQLVDQLFCQDKLDSIGKAVCIAEDFLDRVSLVKVMQVKRK
jgi:hypothetical protein